MVGQEQLDVDVLGSSLVTEKGNEVLEHFGERHWAIVFEQFVNLFDHLWSHLLHTLLHGLFVLVGIGARGLLPEVVLLPGDGNVEVIDLFVDGYQTLTGIVDLVEVLVLLFLEASNLTLHIIEGLLGGGPVNCLVNRGLVESLLSLVALFEQDFNELLLVLGCELTYTL